MVIKNILREELENSERMKRRYERELANLPHGSLVKRNIKGHSYYYLVYREDGKFRAEYRGRSVSEKELRRYQQAKEMRAKYRGSLAVLRRQIRYLRGALRGKEEI